MESTMQEEVGQKLDKFLPRGAIRKIATQFNVPNGYVSKVKSGIKENVKILDALIAVAEANKREKQQLSKRIAKL